MRPSPVSAPDPASACKCRWLGRLVPGITANHALEGVRLRRCLVATARPVIPLGDPRDLRTPEHLHHPPPLSPDVFGGEADGAHPPEWEDLLWPASAAEHKTNKAPSAAATQRGGALHHSWRKSLGAVVQRAGHGAAGPTVYVVQAEADHAQRLRLHGPAPAYDPLARQGQIASARTLRRLHHPAACSGLGLQGRTHCIKSSQTTPRITPHGERIMGRRLPAIPSFSPALPIGQPRAEDESSSSSCGRHLPGERTKSLRALGFGGAIGVRLHLARSARVIVEAGARPGRAEILPPPLPPRSSSHCAHGGQRVTSTARRAASRNLRGPPRRLGAELEAAGRVRSTSPLTMGDAPSEPCFGRSCTRQCVRARRPTSRRGNSHPRESRSVVS